MSEKYRKFLRIVGRFIPRERIYTDPLRRLAWGTDAGFYRLVPQIVVRSVDEQEVVRLLRTARSLGLPVTFRAAGTSLSGQTVSDSILVVAGKHWERYEVLDGGDAIRLQPGIVGAQVNRILNRGLRIMPSDRYPSIRDMRADIQELSDILTGAVRIPVFRTPAAGNRKRPAAGIWAAGAVLLACAAFFGGRLSLTAEKGGSAASGETDVVTTENTKLDLYQFPLETDDSVVLTQQDVRYPLVDNRMDVQVQTSTAVRIMLRDYEHSRDTSEVIDTYSLFTFYTGEGDKRGWQNADLTYDFFYTEDNTLHMELPFQDPNHFNLDYVGVIFQNFNYDESELILDITRCTLVDGAGNSYEMTELLGSHLLFFDEERWQQNMITTENRKYVETFDDIRGGRLIVDARACYLDPVLEVTWTSDNPDIATVDERGRVQGLRQGTATLTATVRDKNTGEERSTQMLVNVISKL